MKVTSDLDEQQRAFRDAELHGDTTALQTLLADDFRSTGDHGVQLDKAQWIDRHAEFAYRSIEMTELSVHQYDGAAILRFVQRSDATWRGTAMTLVNRVSQVWIRQATGWALASIQFSSLPEAAATDEQARILLDDSTVLLRRAERGDLAPLIELLAADQLGAGRENAADLAPYEAAFAAIDADPAQLLIVATANSRIVGTFQLSFLPGLARQGALRAQIEAVRVVSDYRSRGLGAAMMRWAIAEARKRGCALVQLTSDKTRVEAHRFYERLGFVSSHDGFKLRL